MDRRRIYDNRVGPDVVVHQQSMSYARRLMREYATMSDVYELIDLYNQRLKNEGKGVQLRVQKVETR